MPAFVFSRSVAFTTISPLPALDALLHPDVERIAAPDATLRQQVRREVDVRDLRLPTGGEA